MCLLDSSDVASAVVDKASSRYFFCNWEVKIFMSRLYRYVSYNIYP